MFEQNDTVKGGKMEIVGNALIRFEKSKSNIKIENRNEQFCSNVSEYKVNMFRLAKSILHNNTDAEDAVSEAILKSYTKLHTLRDMQSFKPWIMKILVNESYTICNRRKKILYLNEIEIAEESTCYEDKEIWNIVEGMGEEFRIVTILFYHEDLSMKEICKILDLPLGTVKSRLSRARNKLKEMLTDERSL